MREKRDEIIILRTTKAEKSHIYEKIRTLCGVCLCSFVESKAFKIAIVPSADRSMDTCTVCQTRRGHDYVVMNR